jgi:hypothetical protein
MPTFIARFVIALPFTLTLICAEPVFDFTGGGSGTIATSGQIGGFITGSNIGIDHVTGLFTPSCTICPSLSITNGALNFQTGAITGTSPLNMDFAPGGSIEITGGIPALGIPNGSVLLEGSFSGGSLSNYIFFTLFSGEGTDTQNPALASHYGLGSSDYSFVGLDLSGGGLVYNARTGLYQTNTIAATDYANAYVPEPTVSILLATALLLTGAALRRRLAGV